MKIGDRVGRSRLDRICDGNKACKLALARKQHHRLAVLAPLLGEFGEECDVDVGALQQARIAEKRDAPVDGSPDALTGDGRKLRDLGCLQALRFGAAQDRIGERMLAANFGPVARRHFVRIERSAASTPVSVGIRSGAGLVDHERVDQARRSSAAALRTSTPACAPRPVATAIEIGVASPSAQRQAMTSTLIAATSA